MVLDIVAAVRASGRRRIFVVHARLDARIAVRKGAIETTSSRRAVFISLAVLLIAAACFALLSRFWIAAAFVWPRPVTYGS